MSIAGVIDRLDDWINPIVVKELRQAVKSRLVTAVLLLFLGLQLLIVALFLAFQGGRDSEEMSSRLGHELFMVLQGILLGTCMVLLPTYAAIRLNNERSDTNVDLLFVSTLRPASIIGGKFFSALVLSLLVFSCCAPFMTFTYLLRGIDIPSILVVLGIDLLAVMGTTQAGLFLASIPAPRALKFVFFFFAFVMLCYMYAGLVAATSELLGRGLFGDDDFWIGMGIAALTDLLLTGLLFCWSVALISPPSANRALLGRLYLVAMWLILGGVCLAITLSHPTGMREDAMVNVWMVCSVVLFCVQFAISLNERDSWGPRVTRTIPRPWLLRLPAFLFYSGSAGGVLLSVLGVVATLVLGWIWRENLSLSSWGREEPILGVLTALALFTFCYGMSAGLIRYYLLRDRLPAMFTWVLTLFLAIVGGTVPWIVGFMVHGMQMGRRGDLAWWALPNPIWSLVEIGSRTNTDYIRACFVFLIGWTVVLVLLSIAWVGGQLARFQPLVYRHREEPAVVVSVTPVEAS